MDYYRQVKLLWSSEMSAEETRFCAELAHLIGMHSISIEFPVMERDAVDAETIYFTVSKTPDRQPIHTDGFALYRKDNVIVVCLNDRIREAFLWISQNYEAITGISLTTNGASVCGYEPASAHPHQRPPRYDRSKTGLECLFESGLLLSDNDLDGIPDKLDAKLLMPKLPGFGLLRAVCDVSARFGMETTEIEYPLTVDSCSGSANLVRFDGAGLPGVKLERSSGISVVFSGGEDMAPFVTEFVSRFPLANEEKSLLDCTEKLRDSLRMANLDGQLATLDSLGDKATGASCCFAPKAVAKLDALNKRWPHTALFKYTELEEICRKQFDIPWEVDVAMEIIEKLLPSLKPNDKVELFAALSEDKDVRKTFAKKVTSAVEDRGASIEKADVICAYKQGFSWLEEMVVPELKGQAVTRMQILFKPFLRPGTTDWGDENGASPSYKTATGDPERWFDLPLRYLQELFPVDDIIAPVLGISRDDIEMTTYDGNEDITYLVRAFGKNGELLMEDSYKAACSERPYLDQYPEMGLVHPSTGFVKLKVNGKTLLDERVKTDLESIWDVYQSEVLSYCRKYVDDLCNGKPTAAMQPFFAQIRLDITASEPARILGVREDMIDPLNALHEDLYFSGIDFFKVYGLNTTGENIDAPGLFLPAIRNGSGKPSFTMTHYAQRSNTPMIKLASGECIERRSAHAASVTIGEVRFAESGLELVFDIEDETDVSAVARSYVALCGDGLTDMAHLLNGYGRITLRTAGSEASADLPREAEQVKDLSIDDIDIMERRLIGYEDYITVIEQLKRVPNISVYLAGETYQGRDIYAIRLLPKLPGYVSRAKLLTVNPCEIINGRHHANEVSATNAAFMTLKTLLTDSAYEGLANHLNLIIIPFENADGAAIHYELQKEHPTWKLHIARYNSLGKEFYRDYFDVDTIHTEALCIRDHYYRWLPDVYVDNHGVPTHEWEQQFAGYTSPWFKGFWLPRALLYGYYWYIADDEYRYNKRFNDRWNDAIADTMLEDAEIQAWNADWRNRHEKYAHKWMPKLFPADYYKNMINYWVPSSYDPKHGYMAVRFPWITTISFTAEVADETAQGEYLHLCARTHVRHVLAGLNLVLNSRCVYDDTIQEKEGNIRIAQRRLRPIVSVGDLKAEQ